MRGRRSIFRQALTASLLLALAAGGGAKAAKPAAHGAKAAAKGAEAAGDPVHGKALFAQCAGCHSVVAGQNLLGPSLAGVVGRGAASVAGFHYSPAMQASHLVWTRENLDRYLASPATVVSGTSMAFPGVPNARDRADLIAYLGTTGAKGR
ncbi:MAG: cytochrome c, class [Phenylobacterium sp.]|nr:cytochrome c, class [Phenylobacterium sp.]